MSLSPEREQANRLFMEKMAIEQAAIRAQLDDIATGLANRLAMLTDDDWQYQTKDSEEYYDGHRIVAVAGTDKALIVRREQQSRGYRVRVSNWEPKGIEYDAKPYRPQHFTTTFALDRDLLAAAKQVLSKVVTPMLPYHQELHNAQADLDGVRQGLADSYNTFHKALGFGGSITAGTVKEKYHRTDMTIGFTFEGITGSSATLTLRSFEPGKVKAALRIDGITDDQAMELLLMLRARVTR